MHESKTRIKWNTKDKNEIAHRILNDIFNALNAVERERKKRQKP